MKNKYPLPTSLVSRRDLNGKSKRCLEYGCLISDEINHGDAIVMLCGECSQKYILNVVDGVYDKRKYGYINRRAAIQPSNEKAWEACYGHTRIARKMRGEEVSTELTEEEIRVQNQDRIENDKLVGEIEGIEKDLVSSMDSNWDGRNAKLTVI